MVGSLGSLALDTPLRVQVDRMGSVKGMELVVMGFDFRIHTTHLF